MTDNLASTQHQNAKRHRATSKESTPPQHQSRIWFQLQGVLLVIVSFLIIYIDSKSISAYGIIITDRPTSLDVSKYLSSIAEAVTESVQNRAPPALLRGSNHHPSQNIHHHNTNDFSRQTTESIRSRNRTDTPQQRWKLLRQKEPLLNEHTYNEASTHSLTIEKNEESIAAVEEKQQVYEDGITLDTQEPNHDSKQSSSIYIKPTMKEQDQSLLEVYDENISVNQKNDRLSEDKSDESESLQISSTQSITTNHAMTPRKVLCLSGDPYGRTMNQYLQLTTILHQLGINGTTVVAFKNPLFTSFYNTWFEPRDDIIVNYDNDAHCDAEYDAVTLHYMYFADKWKQVAYQFQTLMPKTSIKEQAERAIQEYAGPSNLPVTTVHRRDLEGACVLFAENKNLVTCPNIKSTFEMSSDEYKDACLIDYPIIVNATQGTTVVLYTDGQVPALDGTFPIISKHAFPIQAWMMAISNVHYGNPFSTVDLVVYFWRMALAEMNGSDRDRLTMLPSACYKLTPVV